MYRLLPLLALAALALPATAAGQSQRTISVTGDASLTARNDTARVSFGVEVRRSTSTAALDASSARLRRVIAALRAAGVGSADLQTRAIRVGRLRGARGKPLHRFAARGGVRAVIRDVSRTGAAVDAAVRAGATSTDGPSFFVSDPKALFRRALVAAFRDARAKASQLAAEAGLVLGQAISIQEGDFQGGGTQQGQSAPVEGRPRRKKPPPVRPGASRVEASVSVVFEAR